MATTSQIAGKAMITVVAGTCGLLALAYPDWRAEVRAQGLDPIRLLDVIPYTGTAAANPNNVLDSVGIIHNAAASTCLAEVVSSRIVATEISVYEEAGRGALARRPWRVPSLCIGGLAKNRPICICVSAIDCPCDDFRNIIGLTKGFPADEDENADDDDKLDDDDNLKEGSTTASPVHPVAVRLQFPRGVARVLDELEQELPPTRETLEALASDVLADDFINFQSKLNQIFDLADTIGEGEISLSSFYEEMILLEDEIKSDTGLSDRARVVLLAGASVVRHSLFAGLASLGEPGVVAESVFGRDSVLQPAEEPGYRGWFTDDLEACVFAALFGLPGGLGFSAGACVVTGAVVSIFSSL